MAEVEIFTAAGVFAGTTSRIPLTNDGPNLASPLTIQEARWYPLDGSRAADT